MITKSRLAIVLSKLEQFSNPKPALEQYPTDSEIAADMLWNAFMMGDIKDRIIADLGCGCGTLGIGALLLGARHVLFFDIDEDCLKTAKNNLKKIKKEHNIQGKANFLKGDIKDYNKKVEIILQNPAFGVQKKHADRVFLNKAFEFGDIIYSFHKIQSKNFIEKLSKEHGFKTTNLFLYNFPLKMSMKHHTKKIKQVRVGCWRVAKVF